MLCSGGMCQPYWPRSREWTLHILPARIQFLKT